MQLKLNKDKNIMSKPEINQNLNCPKCGHLHSVKYNPPVNRPEHWNCESCNQNFQLIDNILKEWK